MGRMSRYKKIKSCDPFYKGPRKDSEPHSQNLSQKHFNLNEQEIPRAARDLLRRKELMKNHKTKEKRRKAKEKRNQGSTNFQRIQGEKTKTYFNRIDHEAATKVAKFLKESRKIREGRKKHLNERKKKMKERKKSFENVASFDAMKDNFRFGEVAMQPPCLTAKPRKAVQTDKCTKSLLLYSLVTQNKETIPDKSVHAKSFDSTGLPKTKKRKHMSTLEQEKADKDRERAIMAYRLLRKQQLREKNELR